MIRSQLTTVLYFGSSILVSFSSIHKVYRANYFITAMEILYSTCNSQSSHQWDNKNYTGWPVAQFVWILLQCVKLHKLMWYIFFTSTGSSFCEDSKTASFIMYRLCYIYMSVSIEEEEGFKGRRFVMAFLGKNTVRANIVINNSVLEQVPHFNYLVCDNSHRTTI